jgi:DnaJ-class molecular chaperone
MREPNASPDQFAAGTTKPGDEAPPGTPGTGEDLCRACGGSGKVDGKSCPECGGSGKVNEGIGGA